MLLIARSINDFPFSELMRIYIEGNRENASEFYSECSEGEGLLRAEQDFYHYLHDVFFQTEGAFYCMWQEEDRLVSALRIEPYRDSVLLEALETAPEDRRHGYAECLIRAVSAQLNGTVIYSHVSKRNIPSLRVHENCGFSRILEYASYIDGSVNEYCCTFRLA